MSRPPSGSAAGLVQRLHVFAGLSFGEEPGKQLKKPGRSVRAALLAGIESHDKRFRKMCARARTAGLARRFLVGTLADLCRCS